MCDIGKKGRIV